jgi:hypothetical protein
VFLILTFSNAYLAVTRLLYIPSSQSEEDKVDIIVIEADYEACELYDLRDVFTVEEVEGKQKEDFLTAKNLNDSYVYQVTMDNKVCTETIITFASQRVIQSNMVFNLHREKKFHKVAFGNMLWLLQHPDERREEFGKYDFIIGARAFMDDV